MRDQDTTTQGSAFIGWVLYRQDQRRIQIPFDCRHRPGRSEPTRVRRAPGWPQSYNEFMWRIGRLLPAGVLGAVILFAFARLASGEDSARRLILKDGSYQSVTKYEMKGDRVRYFSSEREEWEELPNSLVDWPATEKYEKERAAGAAAPEAVQLDRELEHEHELEEATLPQVAPGLRLPEASGVFLLDSFQGEAQLVELQQTAGDVNRNARGNILKGTLNPIAGIKQNIELDGSHATVQSHVAVPSLYISADSSAQAGGEGNSRHEERSSPAQPQQPQQPEQAIVPFDKFRIVRTEVKNGKRIVGDVRRAPTGKISQQQHFVKTTITNISGGWLKLTPTEDLAPGEYALVEMMGQEGMNLYLWDFGVNPKAPANTNPWKPDTKTKNAPAPKADQPAK
jgi:hypothetical protein